MSLIRRIGIDIDSVIADTTPHIIEYLNKNFSYNLKLDDFTSYRLQDNKIIDIEHVNSALDWFYKIGIETVNLINGSKEVIFNLSKNNKIILITARPHTTRNLTQVWLKRNNIKYDELIFCKASEKVNYIRYFDLIIEDRLETAETLSSLGIQVILLQYPWNNFKKNTIECSKIIKCQNWEEIHAEIKRM